MQSPMAFILHGKRQKSLVFENFSLKSLLLQILFVNLRSLAEGLPWFLQH